MAPSSPFLVFWRWAHLALQGRSKRSVSSRADGTTTTGHWSPDYGPFCLEGFPIESHQLFTLQIISIGTYHVLGTSGGKVKVAQSRQTLCDPMECSLPGSSVHQNTGVGSLFPSPGDLPNPGSEPRSPALQVDFFTIWATREHKNTGVGSLYLLWWVFPTQELKRGLLQCRWIVYQLSYQGSLLIY